MKESNNLETPCTGINIHNLEAAASVRFSLLMECMPPSTSLKARFLTFVEAFNSTSRYLDDLLNIDNPYFAQMVSQIYPTEPLLNKANPSESEAPFWT